MLELTLIAWLGLPAILLVTAGAYSLAARFGF